MAINQVRPDTPLAETPMANFQKQEDPKPKKPYSQWTDAERKTYKEWVIKNKGGEQYKTFIDSTRNAGRSNIVKIGKDKEEALKKLLASGTKDKPFYLWTADEKAKHKADLLAEKGGKEKYTSFRDSVNTDNKKRKIETLFKDTKVSGFGNDTTAYKKYAVKQAKIAEKNAGRSNLEGLQIDNCNKRGKDKGSCSDKTNVSKGQSLRDTR
jgi:hypothetical protein